MRDPALTTPVGNTAGDVHTAILTMPLINSRSCHLLSTYYVPGTLYLPFQNLYAYLCKLGTSM